ncbi:MAG: MBL fold metallo-hydrolase, partial [Clostridia bacterium]|nr:MBL fold metallo-hydrolase [Clostridia bacterium]
MEQFPFVKITKLDDNLWVLDEMGSNIFLIKGEKKVLVIDTSYGLTDLKAAVKALCGDMESVLVNTHAHGDHNAGNAQFDIAYVGRFDEPGSHTIYGAE